MHERPAGVRLVLEDSRASFTPGRERLVLVPRLGRSAAVGTLRVEDGRFERHAPGDGPGDGPGEHRPDDLFPGVPELVPVVGRSDEVALHLVEVVVELSRVAHAHEVPELREREGFVGTPEGPEDLHPCLVAEDREGLGGRQDGGVIVGVG